jgi:branched-chain amino acid transport system ATP-binding protein
MSVPILELRGLRKSFGALRASDGIDLAIERGELHAVIGPNGAGKTTMVAQISGQLRPDGGTILLDGRDITNLAEHERPHLGLVRSFQITSVFPELSVTDNVALAVQIRSGHSFRFLSPAAGDDRLRRPALDCLEQTGLAGLADRTAATLAHGQRRRLEIAMALALAPRLLVLDEPMAGMGAEESAEMVALLQSLKGDITMVLVEHDMDAVFRLADRISVLVYGRVIVTGRPEEIRANAEVRSAYLGEETG